MDIKLESLEAAIGVSGSSGGRMSSSTCKKKTMEGLETQMRLEPLFSKYNKKQKKKETHLGLVTWMRLEPPPLAIFVSSSCGWLSHWCHGQLGWSGCGSCCSSWFRTRS